MADPDEHREALRQWLTDSLQARGITATRAAKENKIATTTLTKFLNDPNYKFTPSLRIVTRLEHYFGNSAPRASGGNNAMSVVEGLQVEPARMRIELRKAIEALIAGRRAEVWELHSRSMEIAGYLPGDVVVVDPHEQPIDGDVVAADVFNPATGTRRPVFRRFQKPYLVAASFEPIFAAPMLIDDKLVIVKGVVTDRISRRSTTPADRRQAAGE